MTTTQQQPAVTGTGELTPKPVSSGGSLNPEVVSLKKQVKRLEQKATVRGLSTPATALPVEASQAGRTMVKYPKLTNSSEEFFFFFFAFDAGRMDTSCLNVKVLKI